MYHYKEKFTDEEISNRMQLTQNLQETVKKKGLNAVAGLKLNISKGAIDGDALIAQMQSKQGRV